MTRIEKAKQEAHDAHDSIGHVRKYSGLPYWVHLDEVAETVASIGGTEDMVIAAYFHDLLEDVAPINPVYSIEWLKREFGENVARMVLDLTDVFIKENYPKMNRKERKRGERERLGTIGDDSKTIKLADFLSNTADIVKNDPDFARVYLDEKEAALPYLIGGNTDLLNRATHLLLNGKKTLGLTTVIVSAKV